MTDKYEKIEEYDIEDKSLEEMKEIKQKEFMRIAKDAVSEGQLMNDLYQDMLINLEDAKTWEEYFEQYDQMFTDLQRNIIKTSIHKGAEYIDSITSDHPNHEKANDRYNELIKQLEEIK